MNRQIKFRVWDIPNNCFIPNDFYVLYSGSISLGMIVKNWNNYKIGEHMYSPNQTLSQFTGLLDKNGKEIYCGDIVKSDWGYSGVVDFESIIYAKVECTISDNIEVIGNIYENKELL